MQGSAESLLNLPKRWYFSVVSETFIANPVERRFDGRETRSIFTLF